MVFAAQRDRREDALVWSGPVGVFEADKAEHACQAAAKKVGWMGSYFAIDGYPWGVELFEAQATEFGADTELSKMDKLAIRTRELEREAGIHDAADG